MIDTPPYRHFPCISGSRVRLRQIQDADIMGELVEISFYDAVQAKHLAQALEMNAKIKQDYAEGNSIHWGIEDKLTGKIVGTCGYYRGFGNGHGELGCVLLPPYRGQGFMAAALSLAIDFGTKRIGLHRIWAVTNRHNPKAIKLLERLGFVEIRNLENDELEFELA